MRGAALSLIISTYNRPEALDKVLAGVARQTEAPGEILLADDGSTDPTRKLIESWRPKLRCPLMHVWHEDLGFRKTVILNRALALASKDYLVFLDGDCVPHPLFLSDHAKLAEKNFWVQGRRCFVKERFVEDFDPAGGRPWFWLLRGRISGLVKAIRLPFPIVLRNTEQRGIIGCNMGFWRDDLLAINGFDEDYTGWGIGEDSDLGTRLYHLGRARKFVYGHAIVYHLNHPMAGRTHVAASQARLEETIRSRKIWCEKGLKGHLPGAPAAVKGPAQ